MLVFIHCSPQILQQTCTLIKMYCFLYGQPIVLVIILTLMTTIPAQVMVYQPNHGVDAERGYKIKEHFATRIQIAVRIQVFQPERNILIAI